MEDLPFTIENVEKIAVEAGLLLRHMLDTHEVVEHFKTSRQVVTELDQKVESFIKDHISELSSFSFYGEETGLKISAKGYQWIVDPIDGTENLLGYPPIVGISIGLIHDGLPCLGVIYDPFHQILYSAQKGKGATVNGKICRVTDLSDINKARISLDFSTNLETRQQTLKQLEIIIRSARTIKIYGVPALSLAAVASGRLDLFFRPATKVCDFIAGVCIVQESGGVVYDFEGKDWSIHSSGIIAGNEPLVKDIMQLWT